MRLNSSKFNVNYFNALRSLADDWSPPYDPIVIARKLGIRVYKAEFDDSDGNNVTATITKTLINNKNGHKNTTLNPGHNYIINLADDMPSKHQTIMAAHALGHILLGHLRHCDYGEIIENEDRLQDPRTEEEEYRANMFALSLLIPTKAYKMALNAGIKTVKELSILFNVPESTIKKYHNICKRMRWL